MSEIYIVRHGQASFGAKNYDKLSQLGYRQACWLGEYFAERRIEFSHIYRGNLLRHEETSKGIVSSMNNQPPSTITENLNEFDFKNVYEAYLSTCPDKALPENAAPADFYRLLKLAMLAWAENKLPHDLLEESWAEFHSRVMEALHQICNRPPDKPILIVSSGGVISMLMSIVLGLEAKQVIELNMQIRNTGISHFFYNAKAVRLSSFNNIPHLDCPDRLSAVTFS